MVSDTGQLAAHSSRPIRTRVNRDARDEDQNNEEEKEVNLPTMSKQGHGMIKGVSAAGPSTAPLES